MTHIGSPPQCLGGGVACWIIRANGAYRTYGACERALRPPPLGRGRGDVKPTPALPRR